MGFIDMELVGANRGIDDRTSFPVPCYNCRVSICGIDVNFSGRTVRKALRAELAAQLGRFVCGQR